MDDVRVDENGFVWVGGLKVCRLTPWGLLEFFDRDKRRSEVRGSNFVYAKPGELCKIFGSMTEPVTKADKVLT